MAKSYKMFWRPDRAVMVCVLVAMALMTASCGGREDGGKEYADDFTVEVMNGYTPVKNQGDNPVCWAYAMLSTIETEHIMRGDSVNLSVKYAVRCIIEREAVRYYISGKSRPLRIRGTAHRLLSAIADYGMLPYDSYRDDFNSDLRACAGKVRRIVAKAAAGRQGLAFVNERVRHVADLDLGPVPPCAFMLGAVYTPGEFGRSVCAPGEYVALTSFTHLPYNEFVPLDLPDCEGYERFYNLPLDTMMSVITRAVRGGHGVCWEGDISEPGFSFADGTAVLPPGTATDAASRQRAFERFATTDDHCMAIVGIARDASGRRFFIMKNSWGTANPFGGLMYVSEDYVRMKTIAVYLNYEKGVLGALRAL